MERAGTKNKVIVGICRRLEEEDDTRRTVRNKKMREVRWSTSVHRLEGKRGELELDATVDWEPEEFTVNQI